MKKIELTGPNSNGHFTLVDDEDYDNLMQYRWRLTKNGRVFSKIKGEFVFMHRLLLNAKSKKVVKHMDNDYLNNQKSNLKTCTYSQKGASIKYVQQGTSKYKGVCFHSASKKWQATTSKKGKKIHIGTFPTEAQAAHAYNLKATELFGEFAFLNEIN